MLYMKEIKMKTLKVVLPLVVLALVGCGDSGDANKPVEISYSTEKVDLTGELAGCTVHQVDIIRQTTADRRLNIVKCKSVDSTSINYIEQIGKGYHNKTTVTIDAVRTQAEAKLSDSAKELIGVKPKCDLSYLVSTAQTAKAIAAVKEIENLSYEEKLALGVCK